MKICIVALLISVVINIILAIKLRIARHDEKFDMLVMSSMVSMADGD